MRRVILAVWPMIAFSTTASAHALGQEAGGWIRDAGIAALLAVLAALHASGIVRMRRNGVRPPKCWRMIAFAGSIMTLAAALLSPLDRLSEDLFSAHMGQHLLLMLVAAPLFALARPGAPFLWGLPRRLRRALLALWQLAIARLMAALMHPAVVWTAFSATFVFWHLPGPYQLALQSEPIHIIEHVSFLVAGAAFWSVVSAPIGRRHISYGGRLLYVVGAALVGGLPGALILLSDQPFYSVHQAGVARWGLTLLEDQELAGLIMWIPGGLIYLGAAAILFVLWLRTTGRTPNLALARRTAPVVMALLVLAGCDGSPSAAGAGTASPSRGAALIEALGCGGCHAIPGINGADGIVGPPLGGMADRLYIAGLLRNTPDNMIRWLRDPQAIVPGNAMPNMGLDARDAADIAAYLATLG